MKPAVSQIQIPNSGISESDLLAWMQNRTAEIDGLLARPIIFPLSGQFLLDPNEINGWGAVGPYDNSNNQDLGNSQVTNFNRLAGGLCFPFDVTIDRLYAFHRNNNGSAQAWGWVLASMTKTPGSNTVATNIILNEVTENAGVGPRDYQNNQNQLTDIDLDSLGLSVAQRTLTAGDVLVLAVDAPTAVTTNYWVQIQSGYIQLSRV